MKKFTATHFIKLAAVSFKTDLDLVNNQISIICEEAHLDERRYFSVNPLDRKEINLAIAAGESEQNLLLLAYDIIACRQIKRLVKVYRDACKNGSAQMVKALLENDLISARGYDNILHAFEEWDFASERLFEAVDADDEEASLRWGDAVEDSRKKIISLAYRLIK